MRLLEAKTSNHEAPLEVTEAKAGKVDGNKRGERALAEEQFRSCGSIKTAEEDEH